MRPRERDVATPAQAQKLLAVLDPEDRPRWATAFYSGLRRGELIGLRWEDVDLATGVLNVRRSWDDVEGAIEPKSRKGKRAVPIPAVLRDYLTEHRMNRAGEGHVFAHDRVVRRQAERAGRRWVEHGMTRLTLHDARHTYASLIAAGMNAKTLSTFMGHANIAVTLDLYGHLLPGSEAGGGGAVRRVPRPCWARSRPPGRPRRGPTVLPRIPRPRERDNPLVRLTDTPRDAGSGVGMRARRPLVGFPDREGRQPDQCEKGQSMHKNRAG